MNRTNPVVSSGSILSLSALSISILVAGLNAQVLGPETQRVFIYETPYDLTTVAGSPGQTGTTDGTGGIARFNGPHGVAADAQGNVFVADSLNLALRKITPAGVVTTFAGTPGPVTLPQEGVGQTARFGSPNTVRILPSGDLYATGQGPIFTIGANVAQWQRSVILRVTPTAAVSFLRIPYAETFPGIGFGVDAAGNYYCVGSGSGTIIKVSPTGIVTTLAGTAGSFGYQDGNGSAARFSGSMLGVALDGAGNIFVADVGNYVIRKITPTGVVSTHAGTPGRLDLIDGPAGTARFGPLRDIVCDSSGNLFVIDGGVVVRKVEVSGRVTTIAGGDTSGTADGAGNVARFGSLMGIAIGNNGELFCTDFFSHTIRKLTPPSSGPGTGPLILSQPLARTVVAGSGVTFSVTSSGAGLSYQWFRNGVPISGATNSTLSLANVQLGDVGTYSVVVTNSAGSQTSSGAALTLDQSNAARFINLAVRTRIEAGSPLTLGITIGGTGTKAVLIRAIGPTLATFGVSGTMADPKMEVFSGATRIADNDNWAANIATTFSGVGAFALTAGSKDAALITNLAPGGYTIQVAGADGGGGEALVEVYEIP